MAKLTFSLSIKDELLEKSILALANKFFQVEEEPPFVLYGFLARVILPDSKKANFAIGIVDNPDRECAIIQTIFGEESRCQMLYKDLTPEFADALLFKFKDCYNETTGLYELNENEERELLGMLAKVYEEED